MGLFHHQSVTLGNVSVKLKINKNLKHFLEFGTEHQNSRHSIDRKLNRATQEGRL